MKGFDPETVPFQFFGETGNSVPAVVVVVGAAIRMGGPHELGYRVRQQPQSVGAFAQILLILPAFRDIASEFREAPETSVAVEEDGDQDAGPKSRSIAPNAPSLV